MAKSGLQYSSLVGAVVQRLDSMWTRPSLTVTHSAPSMSVADASGCHPALLTAVAGLCQSFILSTSFTFHFCILLLFFRRITFVISVGQCEHNNHALIMLYDALFSASCGDSHHHVEAGHNGHLSLLLLLLLLEWSGQPDSTE